MENIMKVNKLLVTLMLSICMYEQAQGALAGKAPAKGALQAQIQQLQAQMQQAAANLPQLGGGQQGPGMNAAQQQYLQQAQQQIAGLQMPMQQQNQFLVQMQQLLMQVVQQQAPAQVHALASDQHIANAAERLGDSISTITNQLQRGLISKFIIMQTEHVPNIKDIDTIVKFNPGAFQATTQQQNLPSLLQAIFDFDATLARSSIIYETTMFDPFMTQAIPGVRLLKAHGINPYQHIKEQLQLAPTGNQNAINAIQGLVTILLQLYSLEKGQHYKWSPKGKPTGNNLLKAIIAEANSLVNIAQKHDPKIAKQLQWEVDSHHTWRRYTYYGSRIGMGLLAGTVGVLGMRYGNKDTWHQGGAAAAGLVGTYALNKAHQHLTN